MTRWNQRIMRRLVAPGLAGVGMLIASLICLQGGTSCVVAAVPPAVAAADLREYDGLSPGRRRLIDAALALRRRHPAVTYRFGSSDLSSGGVDCSGAVVAILNTIDLNPPRTSADQFEWVRDAGLLIPTPNRPGSLDDTVFAKLRPGDLLFWSGTYIPSDGRAVSITHVQIYLGTEKSDGRRVMIGASDGRTYRGKRCDGFGVFDFRLPGEGSKGTFVGYGPPPGLK